MFGSSGLTMRERKHKRPETLEQQCLQAFAPKKVFKILLLR